MSPLQGALKGVREIGFTVFSISVSLVAVFLPILLMGGIVGRLFREFAVTLSVAIAVSMVISLTTTPMMCALLLRPHERRRHGRLYQASERGFDFIPEGDERWVSWVLRDEGLTLFITLATMATSVYLYVIVPKGFFPQQDTGRLTGSIVADQSSSFQAMQQRLARLAAIVQKDPDVEDGTAFTRGQNPGPKFGLLQMKPKLTAEPIIPAVRP